MNNQPSILASGFIFAIASAALFAIRPIFVKLVYIEGVDSITLIMFRMLFSAPFYLLLLLYFLKNKERRKTLTPKRVIQISAIGLLGYYAASFLDLLGLQYVTAQLGRLILYTYPILVVVFGALFFDKKMTTQVLISLLVTYLGVAFIFGHDLHQFGESVITGAIFILASAVTFAFYLLFAKPLIDEVGSRLFTCIALLSASVAIFVHFWADMPAESMDISLKAVWLILCIAIFCTVIPTFFTSAAVARIGADKTGIVAMIGPVFTSVGAVWILGEGFTYYHFIGIALTILGIWFLQRKKIA